MTGCRKAFKRSVSLAVIFMICVSMFIPAFSVVVNAEEPEVTETETQVIQRFIVNMISGADNLGTVAEPEYVWTPNSPVSGHRFKYQIDYHFSGTGELPAGSVEIIIPKHILKDRDGNWADSFEIAYPEEKEVPEDDLDNDFVYTERGDDIVIYNRLELSAAEQGDVQFEYTTIKQTFDYKDMSVSEPVNAVLNINKSETEKLHTVAQSPPIRIDTTAGLSGLYKESKATPHN